MYRSRAERIIATIEARMTSSRLPGKVMMPIAGVPALQFLIERLKRSVFLDAICVATTENDTDNVIELLAGELGVACFRGSESDVLGRVLGAAQFMNADIIVEITGDCPFVDPILVDRGIEEFFSRDVDYASNVIPSTYPIGFDVQVFPTKVLAQAALEAHEPEYRAHVSNYIYTRPQQFRCYNWEAEADCRDPDLRVTLDEQSDYEMLNMVANALLPKNPHFSAVEVVRYLRRAPEVAGHNRNVRVKAPHEL